MKLSLNFLKDYINLDNISMEELKEKIYLQIIEIESHKELKNIPNLVIGKVLEKKKHENAEKLSVCLVDCKDEVLQIVCGAKNVDKDQLVIVAKENAVLPGNFKIKKSNLRGVESCGMICSLAELGIENNLILDKYKDGIYILPNDAQIGMNPLEYLGFIDHQIELGLTPNRSDLLSYIGVAYDLKAIFNKEVKLPCSNIQEEKELNPINIKIESDKCMKYSCRVLKDVVIKESPEFIKSRLMLSGIRPINNVVDITNYVLLEYGQPLHAFDLDKFNTKEIVVRNAFKEEKVITLDYQERVLEESDLVVTNGKTVECIAGVMGGLNSSISDTTQNIILESAYFDPVSIRKTSKKLNLRSESSLRFERTIVIDNVDEALNRACHLMQKYAGCKVLKNINTSINYESKIKKCKLSLDKVNNYLGININHTELESIFSRLGLAYELGENNHYEITLPNRRVDLENYQDVLEEVARIYSYNKIPLVLPTFNSTSGLTRKQQIIRYLEDNLSNLGLNQALTYSLMNEKNIYHFTLNNKDEYYKLLMPLSEDRNCYRLSILNNLIDSVKYNLDRNFQDLSFFEVAKVYSTTYEKNNLAIVCVNNYNTLAFKNQVNKYDFYTVKGMIDSLMKKFDITLEYKKYDLENENFHPYKTALLYYKNQIVGILGSLHPKYLSKNSMDDVIVLEMNIDFLFTENKQNLFIPINKYPRIKRDLALICDVEMEAQVIINNIKKSAKTALTSFEIFDLYIGENIGENKKSLGITLTFENEERTLTNEETDNLIHKILKNLKSDLNIFLR